VPGLGPLESAIMTAVWDAGHAVTVRATRDRLAYTTSNGEDPAYTTVMTVMGILCRKGLLAPARTLPGGSTRAQWYEARVTLEGHLAAIIREALDSAPDPAAVLRRALADSSPQDLPAPETAQSAAPQRAVPAVRFQPPARSGR
jgi:predicted transcriptional regulator